MDSKYKSVWASREGDFEKVAQEAVGMSANPLGIGVLAGEKFTDAVRWVLEHGLWAAAAAPVLAGVGAGAIASKATAPTSEDMKALEKRLILEEQKRLNASLRRTLALSPEKRRAAGFEDEPQDLGAGYKDVIR